MEEQDHTSPVRLKRLFPPPTSWPSARMQSVKSTKTKRAFQCESRRRGRRKKLATTARMISKTLPIVAAAAALTLISMTNSCQCDTFNSGLLERQDAGASAPFQLPQQVPATSSSQQAGSTNKKYTSSATKDSQLSPSYDSIERQHFRMLSNPIRALVQQRPSKFDSGDDKPFSVTGSISSAGREHRYQASNTNSEKADEGMRHIMRMHELANQQAAYNNYPATASQEHATKSPTSWREFIRSPARVASQLMNSTKIVSQVFSYISPLINSKLGKAANLNASSLLPLDRNFSSILDAESHPLQGTNLRARALNSFASLSNNNSNKSLSVKTLISGRPTQVTSSPAQANSFLPGPAISSYAAKSISHLYHAATQPTVALGNSDKEKYFFGSKGATDSNSKYAQHESSSSTVKDLMADGSNLSVASAPTLSSTSHPKQDDSQSAKSGSSFLPAPSRALSSWIKKHTNQKAQSYLQESFRDLLALSQLPIMSGGTISTAPSVLERGGKQLNRTLSSSTTSASGIGKGSGHGASSSGGGSVFLDHSQGLRAIDELLRLAYIIGTGVRHKKDPLKMLGTNTNPLSFANQVANSFGQRSTKQSMSIDRNQHQQLSAPSNYRQNLKSIILAGLPKNARPRGIMWEMATDPSLAVTVFHLLERASVVLPLGEY